MRSVLNDVLPTHPNVVILLEMKCRVLTSSPGLGRGLVTSLLSDSVWLTLVLGHSGVDSPVKRFNQQLLPSSHRCSSAQLRVSWTYWTISGRIGEVKTFGSGWVTPLAVPSADRIVTVGLDAISVICRVCCRLRNCTLEISKDLPDSAKV